MQDFNTQVDSAGHLTVDEGLRTMVLLALFTDRRADPEDQVQDPSDLKGWWGDTYPEIDGDVFGSKLWMLQGMKANQAALEFGKAETKAALAFMIEDGIAIDVQVEAEIQKNVYASRVGVLRPGDPSIQWIPLWDVTLAGG